MNQEQNLPLWDNSDEYNSFSDDRFTNDFKFVEQSILKMTELQKKLTHLINAEATPVSANDLELFSAYFQLETQAVTAFANLRTFTHCEQSLDAKNEEALKTDSRLSKAGSELSISKTSIENFLKKTTEENFEKIFTLQSAKPFRFYYQEERKLNAFLLSNDQENVITALRNSGHGSWGDLYDAISGSAEVEVHFEDGKTEKMGIAKAAGLTKSVDEKIRKSAWKALQKTWKIYEIPVAAILNNLAEWRLQNCKIRSTKQKMDFLDTPLHTNRISEKTLSAMMTAVEEFRPTMQKVLHKMAQFHGKNQLDPWDLLAPAPVKSPQTLTFQKAFHEVYESFSEMDANMGQFAKMMLDKNWIDASVRPRKANGAYCTGFLKSNTPRVFQSFTGSSQDTSTLAHELGHAYHSWVMKDMHYMEGEYPSTLAETASIFAESVLFDWQIKNAKYKDEKFDALWSIAEGAVGLLVNIPVRFEFEKEFYEKRKTESVSADELSAMMSKSFKKWYGDGLSEPDSMFWATKLHFSIAGSSFYNFPYTFGYLFSQSIYARKSSWGAEFSPKYIAILRDTGLMTAEDLVQKHLNEDITGVEYWRKTLNHIKIQLDEFLKL